MARFASIGDYNAQVRRFVKDLDTTERRSITLAMAKAGQRIADATARRDLGGDAMFSGWGVRLDTQIKATRDGDHVLMPTRSSAGPWTVAEFGRNHGGSRGFVGPGVNTRTGLTARNRSGDLRKVRRRQARRWNGRTRGKRTATQAVSIMRRDVIKAAETEYQRVLGKYFDVT